MAGRQKVPGPLCLERGTGYFALQTPWTTTVVDAANGWRPGDPPENYLYSPGPVCVSDLQHETEVPYAPMMSLDDAKDKALLITATYEGGRGYKNLANDFDGMGMSFGALQWNFGQNTLGPLLRAMIEVSPARFKSCFSDDADYDDLKDALDEKDQAAQLEWARDHQGAGHSMSKAVAQAFDKVGSDDSFSAVQREFAEKYYAIVASDVTTLRSMDAGLMKYVSFTSYAALFDTAVQQGGIGKSVEAIRGKVKAEKPALQNDLVRIAVTERANAAKAIYVDDCLSRRMGILTGKPYKSNKSCRGNSELSLIGSYGMCNVQGI